MLHSIHIYVKMTVTRSCK